jgi:predicted alpha/beta-hydrolase family hydrolase
VVSAGQHEEWSDEWPIAVDGQQTSAIVQRALCAEPHGTFVCAHGAGGHRDDRGMVRVSRALRLAGFDTVRFNFLYRERGSRRPDDMARLQACVDAVVSRTRAELTPRILVIGGRSMGGRAASMLAAANPGVCDGLLLLAYPLHPAGQPQRLRDAHLPELRVPVLCFNGTRDPLCRRDLMDTALRGVPVPCRMHWLEGADHSFHVLRSSGTTDDAVFEEITRVSRDWLNGLAGEILTRRMKAAQ